MKIDAALNKENLSFKWAEQAKMTTFTATICRQDVGRDERSQSLSH